MRPKVRPVQASFIEHDGVPYMMLRDPLGFLEGAILVPQALAPLLSLCDGTRDIGALQAAFELYTGILLTAENLGQFISSLDEALLLDNEKFARVRTEKLEGFRSAGFRPPSLSGVSYPGHPAELKLLLQGYMEGLEKEVSDDAASVIRGVISPHIDYQRGGPVYAKVWKQAANTLAGVERVIVFGTNHLGGDNLFALTRQNYATPLGILPTAVDVVDRLAETIGHGVAFEDELYHRNEHSIELALIWLHYLLGGRKCEVIPVLCGSLGDYLAGEGAPSGNEEVLAVTDCLREASQARRTLVVAAADLAHMGPAFGDPFPIDGPGRIDAGVSDERLMEAMCRGDADGFFALVRDEGDRRRICGLTPIYMTLSVLEGARGRTCGYAQCPADEMYASLVSICGVVLE